ncbi:MAG: RrF2 family transcriptional regulator [Candidatus Kapaibacteriales bacterium]
MIKFSKKLEYALIALQFLGENSEDSFSAREISQILNIPYEFLSKTLQQLSKKGILSSNQGIKGGYKLNYDPKDLKLNNILDSLDENVSIVTCFSDDVGECRLINFCNIRSPMKFIQDKIDNVIAEITLEDLFNYNREYEFNSYHS